MIACHIPKLSCQGKKLEKNIPTWCFSHKAEIEKLFLNEKSEKSHMSENAHAQNDFT